MSDPSVSFVVLSYNFARFIGDCVESILSQQGRHQFEIILVDDASTDDTDQVLRSFRDDRLRIIRHGSNVGHVGTINEAMAEVRGRYVARIDGDDRYRPDFLDTVVPILEEHAEVALVYGDAALMDAAGSVTVATSDKVHDGRSHKGNELVPLLELNFICAPTVIARREAWQACLPVPEGLAFHDWYFTVMMARRHEFYFVDRVLADYRVHAGNLHARTIRDQSEEPSIFATLDRVFNETEADPDLERAKRWAKGRIYGRHYLTLADKYFGMGMTKDARRCYVRAIRHRWSYVFDLGVERRLAATLVGRELYDSSKALLRDAR